MTPREHSDFHAVAPASGKDIIAYVLKKYGVRVFNSEIANVRRQCGLYVQEHHRKTKTEHPRPSHCSPEKAVYIKEALEHFGFFGQDAQ